MLSTTRYRRGDIVLVPFPFSDLSSTKKRPALVVSPNGFNKRTQDVVLVAITSQPSDSYVVALSEADYVDGELPLASFVKISKLFTMHPTLVLKKVCAVRPTRHWERRSIAVFTPHPELLPYPHAKQAYRIQHDTCQRLGGPVSISYSYGITSLSEQAASAQELLALQRGHWRVESANHYRRDISLGEDSSRIRTGHGPSNAAALNNLALTLLLSQRPDDTVPNAQTYYAGNRDEALQLLLNPG